MLLKWLKISFLILRGNLIMVFNRLFSYLTIDLIKNILFHAHIELVKKFESFLIYEDMI